MIGCASTSVFPKGEVDPELFGIWVGGPDGLRWIIFSNDSFVFSIGEIAFSRGTWYKSVLNGRNYLILIENENFSNGQWITNRNRIEWQFAYLVVETELEAKAFIEFARRVNAIDENFDEPDKLTSAIGLRAVGHLAVQSAQIFEGNYVRIK